LVYAVLFVRTLCLAFICYGVKGTLPSRKPGILNLICNTIADNEIDKHRSLQRASGKAFACPIERMLLPFLLFATYDKLMEGITI
jgi:hypothetical protein